MPFLKMFQAAEFTDPVFGTLERSRGYWRCRIALGTHRDVPLLVTGPSAGPDGTAIALSRELPSRYPLLQGAIAAAMIEHHAPYREAIDAGELEPESGADIRLDSPDDVWPHVKPVCVLVEPLDGRMTVEIAYEVAWDIEHTLGARFVAWQLMELNGSILLRV